MVDEPTSMGPGGYEFTATSWSGVLLRDNASPQQIQARMEFLAARYWKPIYSYVRARWHRSSEDAKDLTQQFFLWLIDSDFITKARADRGRFRNFIKAGLHYFMMDAYDAGRRMRSGGRHHHVSLDALRDAGDEPEAARGDADSVLDREWRRVVIEEALGRLHDYCRAEGKELHYRVFEDFYFAEEPAPAYDALARKHGISNVDVANYLSRTRSRYRAMLEQVLSESVGDWRELQREFSDLFGGAS